jgi:hypothetical protein
MQADVDSHHGRTRGTPELAPSCLPKFQKNEDPLMKQFAILLAVVGMIAFASSDAFAQGRGGGGGYHGGGGHHHGGGSAWGFSIGNGYNNFSYGQGPYGGFGFGYGGFAPAYPVYAAPVYAAPVYGGPVYGGPFYGGYGNGFSFGYSNFGGCRH